MPKRQKLLLTLNCFLVLVVYALPFILEGTARKHMMFYRYLVVKQSWWAEEALSLRIALTSLAVVIALVCVLLIIKLRNARLNLVLCVITPAVSAVIMNIDTAAAFTHFMFLIASWAAGVSTIIFTVISVTLNRKRKAGRHG